MRSYTIIAMALACSLSAATAGAQGSRSRSDNNITKEERIVIRRDGHQGNTEIDVRDGNIYVNGEKVATVKDAASGNVHKKIIVEGGSGSGGGFSGPRFFDNELPDLQPRKAMLGVLTNPDASGRGADIREVTPNSAAAKAGLREGDRILKVDNEEIEDAKALVAVIGRHEAGDKVSITYERDGRTGSLQATLTAPPAQGNARMFRFGPGDDPDMPNAMLRDFPFPAGEAPFAPRPKLGITGEDRADGTGVRILNVKPESPAAKAGLKEGDIISRVDGEKTGSVDELQMTLRGIRPNEPVKLEYNRNGRNTTTTVTLPATVKQKDL